MGFSINEENIILSEKMYRLGTVGIFLVAMPLSSIKVSKKQEMKDYMQNEENILKMQGKGEENYGTISDV